MTDHLPDATEFTHLDLSTGRSVVVPLDYQRPRQADTLEIALQSQRSAGSITWAGGMCMFVDLSLSGAGVAIIGLTAATDMSAGRIKKDDYLFSMGVAVAPGLEDRVWKRIGDLYIKSMIEDSGPSGALGLMPTDFPWTAGFAWPVTRVLSTAGRAQLVNYAHLAAATIIGRCRDVYVSPDHRITPPR